MRNANSQRASIIVPVCVLQQPPGPHVSHAEIGGGDTHSESSTIHLRNLDSKEHESKIPPVLARKFS
jgi:hypothetical protein